VLGADTGVADADTGQANCGDGIVKENDMHLRRARVHADLQLLVRQAGV
jgi:hypothetical protein